MTKPSRPAMTDPADTDIHSDTGAAPYPTPAKNDVRKSAPGDDTADPHAPDPEDPHDKGHVHNGEYEGAVDEMNRKIPRADVNDWAKGKTQNRK